MKTIEITLSEKLKADLKTGSIKAVDMVNFLIENGWKTNKPAEETALHDMYTKTAIIKAAHLDYDSVYIETIERTKIEVKAEISNDKISVSSKNTNFINLHNIQPIDFDAIKADIKALRAECRRHGVKFSCITMSKLNELMSEYIRDYAEYTEKFYAARAFWDKLVRNGIYSGYTNETYFCPSRGIEKLTYRSKPISKMQSIVNRIDELKGEDLSRFNMVAI